jgi:hypothetical protein
MRKRHHELGGALGDANDDDDEDELLELGLAKFESSEEQRLDGEEQLVIAGDSASYLTVERRQWRKDNNNNRIKILGISRGVNDPIVTKLFAKQPKCSGRICDGQHRTCSTLLTPETTVIMNMTRITGELLVLELRSLCDSCNNDIALERHHLRDAVYFSGYQHFRPRNGLREGPGNEVVDARSMAKFLETAKLELDQVGKAVRDRLVSNPKSVYYCDTEFAVSRPSLPWKCLEISIVDGEGNVVVDTKVDYGLTVAEFYNKYVPDSHDYWRYSSVVKVYGRPSNARVPGMTPEQIVDTLRTHGMNQDSMWVEWSQSRCDHNMLKQILGFTNNKDTSIIPREGNVWLQTRTWRNNMKGIQTLSLPRFFPLLFPGDDLNGKNHRSLPDTQMLMKVTDVLLARAN